MAMELLVRNHAHLYFLLPFQPMRVQICLSTSHSYACRTGERAVIPFRVDPATGLRFVPPSQFVPAAVVEPQSGFLDGLFDRVFGRFTDPSVVPPPSVPLLASFQSPYVTFPTPRRIYFDILGDHGGCGDYDPSSLTCSTSPLQSTLASIPVF